MSSAWRSFGTTRSSRSTASHGSRASLTSRATMKARATSSAPTPVSATIRETNVMPIELMTSLVTMVATISRRSGWAAIRWPNRSTTAGGKYSRSDASR